MKIAPMTKIRMYRWVEGGVSVNWLVTVYQFSKTQMLTLGVRLSTN